MSHSNVLYVATEWGDIEIREDEIPTITRADLRKLRMSRKVLHQCFALGAELMTGRMPYDRVRPCAEETPDGRWVVHLVRYSALSDPLMKGPAAGTT
jgi:hypothetical protein